MTLHNKELDEPQEAGKISIDSKQINFYRHDGQAVIDLPNIGPEPGKISSGLVDVSCLSDIHPITSYWTEGKVYVDKSKLKLIIESEFNSQNNFGLKCENPFCVPERVILDGLGFKFGEPKRYGEWPVIWTPYFR